MSPARCRAMVIACNFPPDASVGTMRTLRLVRHLVRQDWAVDVVTLAEAGFRAGTVVDPALLAKVPTGVTVHRPRPLRPFERLGNLIAPPRRQGPPAVSRMPVSAAAVPSPTRRPSWLTSLKRVLTAAASLPDREVSWIGPAVWRVWRATSDVPDVIYSSGPPFSSHFVALLLSRLFGRPWVADFRDPWARAPWREDRLRFEVRAWAALERIVVREADAIVFATETNRRDFASQYPGAATKFRTVPNGCDVSDFDGLAPRSDRHQGRFVLLHAGSLYGARNPAVLFEAVASAISNARIDPARFRLRFIGRLGIPGVDLPALAGRLGLHDVAEFASHMPRRDSLQEMLDASALLIVQPVTTVSIPAKLYEYMVTGRPILALAEPGGETSELIRRCGAGVSVLADDAQAIEDALVALVNGTADVGPADRSAYDGDLRAGELHAVLSAVAAVRADGRAQQEAP